MCIASTSEPDWIDFDNPSEYEKAKEEWEKVWEQEVTEHEASCNWFDDQGFLKPYPAFGK